MNETHVLSLSRTDAQRSTPPRGGDAGLAQHGTGASIALMRQDTAIAPLRLEAKRLIHHDREDPRTTDVFRELRTRLLLDSALQNPVILVTGVRLQCGASFVARNLATAIAMEADRTALLIDCNLRRPSQDDTFEPDEGPGLSDFLRTPGLSVERIIYPTGVPRLRIIPAGRGPRVGGDHLASLRMRALISGLSDRYPDRCLVLDAPPARGAPDARILAERADLVVLVAGEGMHSDHDVLEAARVFDPAKLAGVIFNEMP